MSRSVLSCNFALWALAASLAGGAGPTPLRDALVLQAALQDAIARAEPSVACVIVSRSDFYRKLGHVPPSDDPGKLGGFDPTQPTLPLPLRERFRPDDLKTFDLLNPDNVPEYFG